MADNETEAEKKANAIGRFARAIALLIIRSPLLSTLASFAVGGTIMGGGATWLQNSYHARSTGKVDSVLKVMDTVLNISRDNHTELVRHREELFKIRGTIREMRDGPQAEVRFRKKAKAYQDWNTENGSQSRATINPDSVERFALNHRRTP